MALDFEYCVWMAAPERMPGASGNIRSRCGRLENIYNIPHIMLNRRGSNAGGVARLVVAATRVYPRWIKVYFAPCLSAWVLHILSLYSQLTSRRGERATQIARTWGANSLYMKRPNRVNVKHGQFYFFGWVLPPTDTKPHITRAWNKTRKNEQHFTYYFSATVYKNIFFLSSFGYGLRLRRGWMGLVGRIENINICCIYHMWATGRLCVCA